MVTYIDLKKHLSVRIRIIYTNIRRREARPSEPNRIIFLYGLLIMLSVLTTFDLTEIIRFEKSPYLHIVAPIITVIPNFNIKRHRRLG